MDSNVEIVEEGKKNIKNEKKNYKEKCRRKQTILKT